MTARTTLPTMAEERADASAQRVVRAVDEQLRLALVIPTLNEEGNIATVIDRARAALEVTEIPFEILVVDDDSQDRTGAIVSGLGEEDPRVRLIVRKGQRGLSGAIVDGWRQTDAQILGVMDADLQHPPELLPVLYRAVAGGRDLAIGSRYTPGGGIGDWNILRKLLSSAAVWATWPLQRRGVRAQDPMSGFFLVRRECVRNIAFQRAGFKLLLEILIRARVASVEEIPFAFGLRLEGESKANFRVGWDYARLLARLYARRLGLRRERTAGVCVEA
jgi:dolichol-phosphate mannosyltransferase